MNYPNYSDPRTQARVRRALGFTLSCISVTSPQRWAKSVLDKHFGQQQNRLSRYLRETLLICTDAHYSMDDGIPKQYIASKRGIRKIRAALMGNPDFADSDEEEEQPTSSSSSLPHPSVLQVPGEVEDDYPDWWDDEDDYQPTSEHAFDEVVVDEWIKREFGEDLRTLTFNYEDKSSRLWHPLQNVKKAHKNRVFHEHGLHYSYDIEACAPTLILQHAQHQGMDEYLFAINDYLKDRTERRLHVQQTCKLEAGVAKVIINALFCGALLGANHQFSIFRLISSYEKMRLLQSNPFITSLRADIKVCWQAIEPSMPLVMIKNKSGKLVKKKLNSKQKWNRYFQLERSVLDVVREHLKKTGNNFFLEHDGWATSREVDLDALTKEIDRKTGFSVSISHQNQLLAPTP